MSEKKYPLFHPKRLFFQNGGFGYEFSTLEEALRCYLVNMEIDKNDVELDGYSVIVTKRGLKQQTRREYFTPRG
ncbi:hypothetical protein ACE1CM_30820 [Microseira sp. BLCC-F43]